MANAGTRDVTGQLVEPQGNPQSLFTGHGSVKLNLFFQGGLGVHRGVGSRVGDNVFLRAQPFCAAFAQVSLRVIVRLKTSFEFPDADSGLAGRSRQK